METIVSVIVPAYNHELYIKESIESIINQDYKNIELIILNDGSKDDTLKIIKELENKCKERFVSFQIIDKQNEGVSKTLNRGIELSRGEYLTFMASDDKMAEGRITKQLNFMKRNNCKISCGNSKIILDNIVTDDIVITEDLKKQYLSNQFENMIVNYFISTPTIMIQKKIINEYGGFSEDLKIEDWPLYCEISKKYHIDFIDDILCYYRLHGTNTTNRKKFMYEEEKKVLRYIFRRNKVRLKVRRKAISNFILRNKDRHNNKISKVMDVILSQIIYLDIKRIKNKIR